MLENAGAIVYTPRERDWQRNEVIVDNDTHPQGCIYQEIKSRKGKWKTAPTPAFAQNDWFTGTDKILLKKVQPALPPPRKTGKSLCTMDSPYSRNRKICRLCDLSDFTRKCE